MQHDLSLLIIQIQSHGMTNEVLGTSFQTELGVDILHSVLVKIETYASVRIMLQRNWGNPTLVGRGIIILPALKELEELLGATFLKQAHERTCHGLHLCAGNLRDLAITVHVGTRDLLELEVTSDIGVDQNVG